MYGGRVWPGLNVLLYLQLMQHLEATQEVVELMIPTNKIGLIIGEWFSSLNDMCV